MIVVVTVEQRFDRTPDGRVWTQAAYAEPFWSRYLDVFDGVRVVARVRDVAEPPPRHVQANGPRVAFAGVPYYLGPWQYLRNSAAVQRAVRQALGPQDAVIMRVGSQLANCLFPRLLKEQRPYGCEVIGDPWDVFAPGTIRHPLRPLLRRYFTAQLRKQCRFACGAAYVTERTLQARYPVSVGKLSTSFSSVQLTDSAIWAMSVGVSDVELSSTCLASTPRVQKPADVEFRLVFVGSLAQSYKAPDVLLDAVAHCLKQGLKIRLIMIGDGHCRPQLEQQAARLAIAGQVDFLGQLPAGHAIRHELDCADVFVLPSRTEGLPRALIEAMARALPCVASTAGGIPELLADEDLVPPGDAHALAQKIREVLTSPERRHEMALRNLTRARDFHQDVLLERRLKFYRFVRERTGVWQQRREAA